MPTLQISPSTSYRSGYEPSPCCTRDANCTASAMSVVQGRCFGLKMRQLLPSGLNVLTRQQVAIDKLQIFKSQGTNVAAFLFLPGNCSGCQFDSSFCCLMHAHQAACMLLWKCWLKHELICGINEALLEVVIGCRPWRMHPPMQADSSQPSQLALTAPR